MPSTMTVCPVPTIPTPSGATVVSGWVECPPSPKVSCSASDSSGTSTLVQCERNCASGAGAAHTHPRVEVVAPGRTCISCEATKSGNGRARAFAQKGARSCTNLQSFAMNISVDLKGPSALLYLRLNCHQSCDGPIPLDAELWLLADQPIPPECTTANPETLYGLRISASTDDPQNLDIQHMYAPHVTPLDAQVEIKRNDFSFSAGRATYQGRINLLIGSSGTSDGNLVIEMIATDDNELDVSPVT